MILGAQVLSLGGGGPAGQRAASAEARAANALQARRGQRDHPGETPSKIIDVMAGLKVGGSPWGHRAVLIFTSRHPNRN